MVFCIRVMILLMILVNIFNARAFQLHLAIPCDLLSNDLYRLGIVKSNPDPPRGICILTSAFGTCIQKYVIERYVCLIVFMVIAQTHVQAVATVH